MSENKKDESDTQYQAFTFEVPLESYTVHKEIKSLEAAITAPKTKRAIALIGDRFMRGNFLSAIELEKASQQWKGTLHDINHMGTTYRNGFSAQSNILYFVGWQDNVFYDAESKAVSMDIHPDLETRYGRDWNAFVGLCEKAGRIPNVSVSFLGKVKQVKASELPEGTNYSAYGYGKDDMVNYIYDIKPRALSTVLEGLCNDKQGCGIATNTSADTSCDTKPPKVEEVKENKEDAKKRAYIEKRLKQMKGGQ